MKISNKIKYSILALCFGLSCFGFLIKLPAPFRRIDSEMHYLFFFLAAAFINILFQVKKVNTHLMIYGMLFLFSALIEFSQEYSNKFLNRRIHGNFDPDDLKFNLLGLTTFSAIWLTYFLITLITKRKRSTN